MCNGDCACFVLLCLYLLFIVVAVKSTDTSALFQPASQPAETRSLTATEPVINLLLVVAVEKTVVDIHDSDLGVGCPFTTAPTRYHQ